MEEGLDNISAVMVQKERYCTLNIIFLPRGSYPCIGLMFRGTRKRISTSEKVSYSESVHLL